MRSNSSDLRLALLSVAVGLVFVLALALTPATWAAPGAQDGTGTAHTPPPHTPATGEAPGGGGAGAPGPTLPPGGPTPAVCILGSSPLVCTNLPGGEQVGATKFISVPVGAVISGTQLTITGPVAQPPCPATPVGQLFLDHCFQIDWTTPSGGPFTTFPVPIYDCLSYTSGDVAAAGGNVANLRIGLFLAFGSGTFTIVTPTVDAANSRICTNVTEPFLWQAMFTPMPTLPVTGGEPDLSMTWLLAPLVFLALALAWRAVRTRTS